MNGTWKPGFYYGTIKDGFTDIAPYGPKVTREDEGGDRGEAARRSSPGKFNVFTGPLYDQTGKLMVPTGKTLKVLPDLYAMQWLVKGVIGKVSTVQPPG